MISTLHKNDALGRFAQWSAEPMVNLPRTAKRAIAVLLDCSLAVLTVWLAFYLRIGEWTTLSQSGLPAVIGAVLLAPPIFVAFGLYRAVFRYVGWEALAAVAQAVLAYGLIYAAVFTAWGVPGVPRTVGIIQPVLLLIAVGASRAFGRYWLGNVYRLHRRVKLSQKRLLIYGANQAGNQLSSALSHSAENHVVGYVDDDAQFHGRFIGNLPIWSPEDLPKLTRKHAVDEVLLALPHVTRTRRNEILAMIRDAGVAVRTLPNLIDLASGKVTTSDIRPLEIEDLLGREPIVHDQRLLSEGIHGKVVLVTGAGGSIGSELCRQILACRPHRLLLIDSSEHALFQIHRELSRMANELSHSTIEVVPMLASVCDRTRLEKVLSLWRPDIVYHAAAYKHVSLVEQNVVEGTRNNVFGTLITARLAQKYGAKRFVLISTDKAVRPTSVMGTSKRLAEMALQALAAESSDTRFTMVRFGNVLGSSGSVVPLFRQQIAEGGPITVTHPEVIRYFMTIPEAANLVLQAGAMANGGEVFVLDMGEPVRVLHLAQQMVELSGLKVRTPDQDGDIEIVFTGLRPGEKLYEELLIGNEPAPTVHPRILMANENFLPLATLEPALEELERACRAQSREKVWAILERLVPEYAPSNQIVDWTHIKG